MLDVPSLASEAGTTWCTLTPAGDVGTNRAAKQKALMQLLASAVATSLVTVCESICLESVRADSS